MLRPALVAVFATTIAAEATAQSTGVPICDHILERHEICVNAKLPPDQRDKFKDIIDRYRKHFRDVANRPPEMWGGKSEAESRCKEWGEVVKAHLRVLGCTF